MKGAVELHYGRSLLLYLVVFCIKRKNRKIREILKSKSGTNIGVSVLDFYSM